MRVLNVMAHADGRTLIWVTMMSTLAWEATPTSIQWVPRYISPKVNWLENEADHWLLLLRLRMCKALLPCPQSLCGMALREGSKFSWLSVQVYWGCDKKPHGLAPFHISPKFWCFPLQRTFFPVLLHSHLAILITQLLIVTTTNVIYSIALKFFNAEFVTLQNYLLYLPLAFLGFMTFCFHSNPFLNHLHTP
jgi:hypothetical protein